MQFCIEDSIRCAQVYLQTAMNQCLGMGRHVEPEQFRLMMNCAESCEASAKDYSNVSDMEECASTCRQCAESCRQMAGMITHRV
jgi:hypothetical protein